MIRFSTPDLEHNEQVQTSLLILYMRLLRETMSPEVVQLSVMAAMKDAEDLGLDPKVFEDTWVKIVNYWQQNRSIISRVLF